MNILGIIFIAVGVVGILFILLRGVTLWYWKINKIEDLLLKIEKNTRKDNDI